jgi:glycine C-acetyltransferase/8-amino-7-oxononanoate synthase
MARRAQAVWEGEGDEFAPDEIEARLAELQRLGLHRNLRLIVGSQGPQVLLDGREVTLLCSNNYLGLADHPRVREAAAQAALEFGVGAGASRLVSGTMTIHRELEERLAQWKGSEACVLFGSGYLANMGTIGALAGRGTTIFSDALNHASIVDGCRGSDARVVVYRHGDMEHLEWCLRRRPPTKHPPTEYPPTRDSDGAKTAGHGDHPKYPPTRDSDGAKTAGHGDHLIVTDAVFSMDGDVAPLAEIVRLARKYGARTLVDEAHATGVIGPGGRGAVAAAGLQHEVDVVVGTLSKALGSYGAYVCARGAMIEYLINTARPLIFSTAPGPPAVAGALAALTLLQEEPAHIERLHTAARALRAALAAEGFATPPGEMPIVPLIVGDARATMQLCEGALRRGVFAQGIRPPSVPEGSSRLRLTAMATHTQAQLGEAASALGAAARELRMACVACS